MADTQIKHTMQDILARHKGQEGPLLPILHSVQAEFGFIPGDVVQIIADDLNITRAEVHGVITFYHDFRDAPAGKHIVKICRAEACQAVGGNAISERAFEKLGVGWHGTTTNGAVTLEPVYCLGLCACGPAAMVDNKVVGRVDADKLDRLLQEAGA
ncbi:formate dehydrogenase subunit gamma [Pseudooctadecabacter sp.]|uniref:formate dehydrogenase subunit gamma n=1 Tax=Pseudooctadecabacter sp. TaxID=1966338 RepID=UPI0035C851DE